MIVSKVMRNSHFVHASNIHHIINVAISCTLVIINIGIAISRYQSVVFKEMVFEEWNEEEKRCEGIHLLCCWENIGIEIKY